MSEKIIPTVGRIVWFTPADHDGIGRLNGQPLAAIVAGVHSDNLVNLAVFDAYGNTQQRSNVRLVQPGEATPDGAPYAAWMPYQVKAAGIELPVVEAPAPASDTPATEEVEATGDTTAVTDAVGVVEGVADEAGAQVPAVKVK